MRLFVALSLPEEVRLQLAGLCAGVPGARWVAPENLHLTLRFIGEVDNDQAHDIHDMLTAVAGQGFALTLSGVGAFTEGRRVKAVWAGVEENETLLRLQAKVEQAVARAGLQNGRRKFTPHVSLARVKSDPGRKLQDFLVRHALFRCGPFPVEEFVLYSSFLAHSGAIYQPEAVYPLERLPAAV
jgi:2'-5' RNA ligase